MASPLFPKALSYFFGIFLSQWTKTPLETLIPAVALVLVTLWSSYYLRKPSLTLICSCLAFVGLGVMSPSIHDFSYPAGHLKRLLQSGQLDLNEPCRSVGVCTKNSIRRGIGEQFELNVEKIENKFASFRASGKIRLALYYPKGELPPMQALLHPGDRVEVLANLHVPRGFNNPGQFDSAAHLERQDVFLVGTVKSELLITRLGNQQGGWLRNIVWRLRSTLLQRLNLAFPQTTHVQEIARALLLGEKQGLHPAIEQAFQATGIYHVLVVSGQHVAIIALFMFLVFKWMQLPKGVSALLTFAALCLYSAITEEQPSIVRATLMAGVFLVSLYFDRDRNLLNSLSLAALLILLYDPRWLFDPGFQLSFLSVLAIAVIALPALDRGLHSLLSAIKHVGDASMDARFSPKLADHRIRLRQMLKNLNNRIPSMVQKVVSFCVMACLRLTILAAEVFVVSLAIQTVFIILMILYFHRVSSVALALNLVVVPLVGLIVPIGFLCLLASFISPTISLLLARICILLLHLLQTLATRFSGEEWGNFRLPAPPLWLVAIYFVLLAVLVFPAVPRTSRILAAATGGIVLFFIVFYPFAPRSPADKLQITFIDVRQGDSILLSFSRNTAMLIDGGGLLGRSFGEVFSEEEFDIGERVVSPCLWSLGLRRIDRLVLTHAHHDHMSGLRTVLNNFEVGELWIGNNPMIPEYVELLKAALRKNIVLQNFHQGEVTLFAGGRFEFLNPAPNAPVGPTPKNNDSLAFRLQFHERSFLLTGDIERKVEDEILGSGADIRADVLKVAHHGSRTSTSSEFLSRVRPVWAMISVSASSPFGHPHPETIQRFKEHHLPVFRTDRDGAITLTTDGRGLEVYLYAER